MNHTAATRAARAARRMCRRLGQALCELGKSVCRALRAVVLPVPRPVVAAALPDGRTICFADVDMGAVGPASSGGGQTAAQRQATAICPACKNRIPANAPKCPICGTPLYGPSCSKCHKGTALVLCSFLGGLGGHRFYVGKFVSAILQLVVTVCGWFCLFYLPLPGSLIVPAIATLWAFIDLIRILAGKFRDGQGCPLALW